MNLHDLAKRRDRDFVVDSGSVDPIEFKRLGRGWRAVKFSAGSQLVIRNASAFSCLNIRRHCPDWQVQGQGVLTISVRSSSGAQRALAKHSLGLEWDTVTLNWSSADAIDFDLVIRLDGEEATLCVGPLFDIRGKLISGLEGDGIEVGPGLNPAVKESASCRVVYVESASSESWAANYGKASPAGAGDWSRYIEGDAHTLDVLKGENFDFLFSNHVFEHLVNPLGVLENWWALMRPGGRVLAVVPDCRFSFDARQPPTTLAELCNQFSRGDYLLTDEMYEKWCRNTQPKNTPDDLKRRGYSIHANYYTPELLHSMIAVFSGRNRVSHSSVYSTSNGRDIGFMIEK